MTPELAEPPRYLQIEPVGQCNLRCRMCPIQFRRDGLPPGPPAFLDPALFRRLIDAMPQLEELHLQGMGEPLMHPQFFELVRYATARSIRVSTNSNLTLLTERRARACIDSGLHSLHVSLDGASAETYEYIRVRGRFHRVLRNLRRLIALRDAAGSATPALSLTAVAMRRNLDELPALVTLAARLGIQEVNVQHLCHDFSESSLPPQYRPMRAFVDAETLLQEPVARVAAVLDRAREEAKQHGIQLRLPSLPPRPHPPELRGRKRCGWPWQGPYVSYAGDVMPCCMVATPDRACLGDLRSASLQEIWNGPAYADFRRRLDSPDPPEVCRGCAVYAGVF